MVTPDTRGRAQHTWSHLTCMVTPDTRGHVRHVRGAADCTHRHSILQRGVIPAHRCRNCSPRLPRSSWEPMSGAANPSRGSEHLVRGRAAPLPRRRSPPLEALQHRCQGSPPRPWPTWLPLHPRPTLMERLSPAPPGTRLAPTRPSGTQGHASPLPSETLNSKTRPALLHGANCFNLN